MISGGTELNIVALSTCPQCGCRIEWVEETETYEKRRIAPAKDEANITIWGAANTKVQGSGYGPTTWQGWCDKEMARMTKGGHSVEIVTNDKGQIAIARKD